MPTRGTPAYRTALRQTIQTPPQELGYGLSTWSGARLGQHLKRQTEITLSDDQLERLLHCEGFSVQRPKHTL